MAPQKRALLASAPRVRLQGARSPSGRPQQFWQVKTFEESKVLRDSAPEQARHRGAGGQHDVHVPSPICARCRRGIAACAQHAVLVRASVPVCARQARRAGQARACCDRSRSERDRGALGRGQQRLDAPHATHALGRRRIRRSRLSRLVPGELQSPVVGRYPRTPASAEPTDPNAEVLSEAAADLCAGHRPRVVGARFSLHAPPLRRRSQAASGKAVRRHRRHAPSLREVCPGAHQRDELRGRARASRRPSSDRSAHRIVTC